MSRDSVDCKFVPVVPSPDPEGYKPTNRINLSVSYDKGRKMVYLSVSPCHVGNGMMSTMLMSGKLVKLEGMARLNYRRLEALAETVNAQVRAKAGDAWAVVLQVVEKEGLILEGEPLPTTALLDDDEEIEIIELED